MRKFTILTAVFLLTLLFNVRAKSQTPVQINVSYVEISQSYTPGITKFVMKATDSSQNVVQYSSADSSAIAGNIPYVHGCKPCSPPKVFRTNLFENTSVIRANLGANSGQIKIYLTSSASDSLYLNQLVFSKKRNFFVNGNATLTGRVEVTNQSGSVIAYDDDVDLTGQYSIEFTKPYIHPSGRKLIDCKSLIYSLEDLSSDS